MRRSPPRDIAQDISDLIIAKIETGVLPWSRPWSVLGASGRPLRHNGEPYSGINTLYLWAAADTCGYRSRYWMTYRQATDLGGQVRRGESGTISVYFNQIRKADVDVVSGEEVSRTVRFMRAYVVFNCDQIDGLPPYFYGAATPEPPTPSEHQARIDAFFAPIPIEVRHGGDRAFYNPTHDFVQLPHKASFRSSDHYASTRAHELTHATGASHRLARTFGKRFGDKAYAFEELCADMGAGICCSELGLPNELHDSHASYIAHWLSVLKADKTAIIHAASKAEQAFRYLAAFSRADECAEPASTGVRETAAACG